MTDTLLFIAESKQNFHKTYWNVNTEHCKPLCHDKTHKTMQTQADTHCFPDNSWRTRLAPEASQSLLRQQGTSTAQTSTTSTTSTYQCYTSRSWDTQVSHWPVHFFSIASEHVTWKYDQTCRDHRNNLKCTTWCHSTHPVPNGSHWALKSPQASRTLRKDTTWDSITTHLWQKAHRSIWPTVFFFTPRPQSR